MGAGVFAIACISPVGYSPGLFFSSSDQELRRIRLWHKLLSGLAIPGLDGGPPGGHSVRRRVQVLPEFA